MKTTAPLFLAVLPVAACQATRPAASPLSCDGIAPVAVTVETASLWTTSRLSDRVPAGPRAEGILVMVRPGPSPAAVDRSLRCGGGRLGEAFVRAGVSDLDVREVGPHLVVRARTSSPALAEALVADIAELARR